MGQDFNKDIERSARKIFKLFFGSRIYKKRNRSIKDDLIGVNLDLNGEKKLSFYMEKKTAFSIMKSLTGSNADDGMDAAYDIIGEMANMITGNAIRDMDGFEISVPKRSAKTEGPDYEECMAFSSKLGNFAISIAEI